MLPLILLAPILGGVVLGTEAAGDAPAGRAKVSCPIDRGPVTTNILLRVFPVRIGAKRGTAFTVEIENRQYIVTAKHVLEGELPATVEVELDDWTRIPVTLVGRGRRQQDVLVLATDRQLSVAFPVDVGMAGLILGQSVRFLGYFPRVRTSPLPGYKKRGAPLVMSGIVSGLYFDETGADGPSLWIDGHNNKGFSGGPVVFQPAQAASREECRWRIAGVISGYVPAPVEIRTMAGQQAAAVAISNAGLLRAIPIRTVRELAMKNPIGFRLDR